MSEKKMTGREVLEEAMRQYDAMYCDAFPPCEEEIDLGEEYQKNMEKLIRRSKKRWLYTLCKFGGYAAIFVLVIAAVFGSSLNTYGESKFTAEMYTYSYPGRPDTIFYGFPPDEREGAPKKVETVFEMTYIPEGYELVEHWVNRYSTKEAFYHYENEQGDYLMLEQKTLSVAVGFNTPQWRVEIIRLRDCDVVYAKGPSGTTLFWGNYGYSFRLTFSKEFSREEILKIFDSIQKV